MRHVLLVPVFAIAICSQSAAGQTYVLTQPSITSGPAQERTPVQASAQAQVLAEQIRIAIASHDPEIILNLAKWDGVLDVHREIFSNFVAVLVEQDIEGVFLESLGDSFVPFEDQGVLYAKNGKAVGQVTVSFVADRPTGASYLHWPYGVEDGKAVILLDAPVTADMAK